MTGREGGRILLTALLLAGGAGPVAGQRVQVGASVSSVRLLPEPGAPGAGRFTGVVGGGEGRLRVGPAGLEVSYAQGVLRDDSAAVSHDLVEGSVLLGGALRPWLFLAAGPHVRSYVTPLGTQRWVFWEGHARATVDLLPGVLSTYLEGWWAAGGTVTGADEVGGGGIEGGIGVRIPGGPLWLRGAYRVERATLGAAGPGEALERLRVTAGAAF